jgi:hypothetical protein
MTGARHRPVHSGFVRQPCPPLRAPTSATAHVPAFPTCMQALGSLASHLPWDRLAELAAAEGGVAAAEAFCVRHVWPALQAQGWQLQAEGGEVDSVRYTAASSSAVAGSSFASLALAVRGWGFLGFACVVVWHELEVHHQTHTREHATQGIVRHGWRTTFPVLSTPLLLQVAALAAVGGPAAGFVPTDAVDSIRAEQARGPTGVPPAGWADPVHAVERPRGLGPFPPSADGGDSPLPPQALGLFQRWAFERAHASAQQPYAGTVPPLFATAGLVGPLADEAGGSESEAATGWAGPSAEVPTCPNLWCAPFAAAGGEASGSGNVHGAASVASRPQRHKVRASPGRFWLVALRPAPSALSAPTTRTHALHNPHAAHNLVRGHQTHPGQEAGRRVCGAGRDRLAHLPGHRRRRRARRLGGGSQRRAAGFGGGGGRPQRACEPGRRPGAPRAPRRRAGAVGPGHGPALRGAACGHGGSQRARSRCGGRGGRLRPPPRRRRQRRRLRALLRPRCRREGQPHRRRRRRQPSSQGPSAAVALQAAARRHVAGPRRDAARRARPHQRRPHGPRSPTQAHGGRRPVRRVRRLLSAPGEAPARAHGWQGTCVGWRARPMPSTRLVTAQSPAAPARGWQGRASEADWSGSGRSHCACAPRAL